MWCLMLSVDRGEASKDRFGVVGFSVSVPPHLPASKMSAGISSFSSSDSDSGSEASRRPDMQGSGVGPEAAGAASSSEAAVGMGLI